MPNIHQLGISSSVFTAVLAHCTSDIKPPPYPPEQTFSGKGKHNAVIPMGEDKGGKNFVYLWWLCRPHGIYGFIIKGRSQFSLFYSTSLTKKECTVDVHCLLTTSFIAYLTHCDFSFRMTSPCGVHKLSFPNVASFTKKSHKEEAIAK